jgi:hypothetical protein
MALVRISDREKKLALITANSSLGPYRNWQMQFVVRGGHSSTLHKLICGYMIQAGNVNA